MLYNLVGFNIKSAIFSFILLQKDKTKYMHFTLIQLSKCHDLCFVLMVMCYAKLKILEKRKAHPVNIFPGYSCMFPNSICVCCSETHFSYYFALLEILVQCISESYYNVLCRILTHYLLGWHKLAMEVFSIGIE